MDPAELLGAAGGLTPARVSSGAVVRQSSEGSGCNDPRSEKTSTEKIRLLIFEAIKLFGLTASIVRIRIPAPRLPTGKPQGQVNPLPGPEPCRLQLRQQRAGLVHPSTPKQLNHQDEANALLPEV